MSHHIYQTEGFVLKTQNFGESNKLLYILTKDLGFIVAFAQGVRELKSKLSFSVQDFSRSYVDLVRGKEMWRITNAENIKIYKNTLKVGEKRLVKARIYSLLSRLLHGEEKNQLLFNVVSEFVEFLELYDLDKEELSLVEIAVNLKILHLLGYGSANEDIRKLTLCVLSKDFLQEVSKNRQLALREINRGLKESQL